MARAIIVGFAFVLSIGVGRLALAQAANSTPSAIFHPSYAAHEAERQLNISRQLGLNDQMKWYHPSASTVYFRYPYSLNELYAYGQRWPAYGPVFEPWPYVPGDIWGYLPNDNVRQPIGQRQVQTGPNRWESFPVYDNDATPVAVPPARPERPRLTGPREF